MQNEAEKLPIQKAPPKKIVELESQMISIMRDKIRSSRLSPFDKTLRNEIYKEFLKLPNATEHYASLLFDKCAKHSSNFLEMGLLIEHVVRENLDTQKQLQEIKDKIFEEYLEAKELRDEGEKAWVGITKDPALAMINALKGKTDAQKLLADSVFKQIGTDIERNKVDIMEKNAQGGGSVSVHMHLGGTLEEKTKRALEIAEKHADVINASFDESNFNATVIEQND